MTELKHTEQRRVSRVNGNELSGRSETQGTLRCTGPVSGARERGSRRGGARSGCRGQRAWATVGGVRGHTGRAGRSEGAHSEGVPDGSRLVCSCDERRAPGRLGTAGRSHLRTSPLAGKVNLLDKNTRETAVAVYTRRPPGGASGKGPPANGGGPPPGVTGPTDPGGECGSPLQYSSLGKSPMDRGAWPATVHKVTKSQTLLE